MLDRTQKYIYVREEILSHLPKAKEILQSYVVLLDALTTLLDVPLGAKFDGKRNELLG